MEENITNNIKAQNQNIEVLKKHFGQCFDKSGNFDFEKFKQELSENEIDFYKESYGIDWLGKSYARVLASDPVTTLLKEDEEFNKKEENKNSENLLLKGDNLEVLKHLTNAYYEKIKMIYIDPPYNTGSDGFVYQDDRKFSIDELKNLAGVSEEKAKRILDFVDSKSNSHSAWLTFMYPRLYIAKQLLVEDGLIFISIDDNELAQLRILLDEVFSEEGFLGLIARETGTPTGGGNDAIVNKVDYLLVYSKSGKNNIQGLPMTEAESKIYDKEDQKGKYLIRSLRRTGGEDRREDRPSMYFPIISPDGTEIFPIGPTGYESRWICGKDKVEEMEKDGMLEWKEKDGIWTVYQKFYLEGRLKQPSNLWSGIEGNKKATRDLKKLFDDKKVFDFPKPVGLLQNIIQLVPYNENDIILDFFAGSGSTGEAVIKTNIENGEKRNFILVQLPELINKEKDKVAYKFVNEKLKIDTPTIFDVTKERLIRSTNKIKTELKVKESFDIGFKIFETTPIWEDYGFDSKELSDQTKLFDETKLNEEDLKALLITWKTFDGSPLTEQATTYDFEGYTGYYVNSKLYLMDKGFSTSNLTKLLEKIDSDKNFNPTSVIAFGYHFDSKNLREISENIKSYANKKNIDIDFITRY